MTPFTLDHIVLAVRDLDRATASYRRLFGLAPSWRGRHPTYGTANMLFRLDNTYIELLAPDESRVTLQPDGDNPAWQQALREHLDRAGEGLYAIALGTDDIAAAVACARERGLKVGDPAEGDGVDLVTGARREWTNARIAPTSTRGVRAFFIQHRSPPDALSVARPELDDGAHVLGVDHIVLASSHLADTLRLWHEALGLDLRATVDWAGGRRLHFLRLGGTVLELAGEAQPALTELEGPARPAERDLLWGVSYRVGDVAATVERLRAQGIVVSDARPGHAPNTFVADLRPGYSHDVRTLLIQKDLAP